MRVRQFLRNLRAAGCIVEPARGKGGHMVIRYQGRWTTAPVHGAVDIGPNFLRKICKQVGLDPKEVLWCCSPIQ